MNTTIKIPELGEGVDTVDVVAVLVQIGDRIAVDQPLIEVETEKASVEVPATAAGTVTAIHVEVGASLGPDAPIVTVDVDDAAAGDDPHAATQPIERAPAPAIDEPDAAPDETAAGSGEAAVSESGTSGSGSDSDSGGDSEQMRPRQPATDQAAHTPASPQARKPSRSQAPTPSGDRRLVPAAPTVRRFAREVGIDIATVGGTGPGGRISIDDVKAEVGRRLNSSPAAGAGFGVPTAELPDFSRWGEVRREPMTKIRSLTADNLTRAWLTAPQVTHHELADITDLEDLRAAFKARVESAGGKLSLTAILIKTAATALRRFPNLNASIDAAHGEIIFKDFIHIGVAVDTDRGLLVPVIRNADRKNITTISIELDDLASRARNRKLKPDEMQGGTFSISNLGGIGGSGFSPIVNWPEVAILGVSRGRIQPEWNDGLSDFVPRLMLPLSLSYDHRLIDGAEAARFLHWLTEALEQPLLLALEG